MKRASKLLAFVSILLGSLHLVRLRGETGLAFAPWKLLAEALSPLLALAGLLGALLGLFTRAPVAVLAGLAGALASGRYFRSVLAAPIAKDGAPVAGHEQVEPGPRRSGMLARRWSPLQPLAPAPVVRRDDPFCSVPLPAAAGDGERCVYCDLWGPPVGVTPSGLGLIYLHGSAWYFGDKDQGTRTFFRHLAGQGHTIMDVAYRMCPETDVFGMIADLKHAVAAMKERAGELGIDPNRIVLSGGSAGGHLALLGAYTAGHPAFTPPDLHGLDTSVCAVIAYYGPADLRMIAENPPILRRAGMKRTNEDLGPIVPPLPGAPLRERLRYEGIQVRRLHELPYRLLGGRLEEVPDVYALASPLCHVRPGCPPTLLIQGVHDMLVDVEGTRVLRRALIGANVPVTYLELPATEHGFDLLLPRLSPPAQVALYEVERFLATLN